MAGKKKPLKFKKVAKEVAIGVRVCCSNVEYSPSPDQRAKGMERLLGKAEGVVIDFEPKSKKWIVKLDGFKENSLQLFSKNKMTVMDYIEKMVRSNTKKNVVLVGKKKSPPSAIVVDGGTVTLTQMERDCHNSGTPTISPMDASPRKAAPTTPPPNARGFAESPSKRPRLTSPSGGSTVASAPSATHPRVFSPSTQHSTPTPKTTNTSASNTPVSKASLPSTVAASTTMTQDAEVLVGDGPVEYNLEATAPARILQHLKTTGLDPDADIADDERTESVNSPESFQLQDIHAATEVEDSTITNDDLGYETDDTVITNGEMAAADEAPDEDVTQYPVDLEVFIDQNSDATPPPLFGQRFTFHDLEDDELEVEIRHRSERARSRAMAEEAVVEVDETNDEVLRWVPIAKSVPSKEQEHDDYEELGVRGVKFNSQDFNPLDYFILMFPGDWRLKLHQLNVRIDQERKRKWEENKKRNFRERGDYMDRCSEDEFWRFIGIIIAASLHRNGGKPLWSNKGSSTCAAPNFGVLDESFLFM